MVSQLKSLYQMLLNEPTLIGKLFNHSLALLSLSKYELNWINAHTHTPPASRKGFFSSNVGGSYKESNFRDPDSMVDLIFYIFHVTRLIQKNLLYINNL